MKNLITKLSIFLAGFILAIGIPAFAQNTYFSDVDYDAYYSDPLNFMTAAGVITGYADGTFRPAQSINRAEAITIMKRYDDFARDRSPITINNVSFSQTSSPGNNAGESNFTVTVNFRSSKPAKIIVSGGSRQVSDNSFMEEHTAQLTLTVPNETLPRVFNFTLKAIDQNDKEAVETREFTLQKS